MDQEAKEEWLSSDFVAGVFDTQAEVESASGDLETAGYPRHTIRVFSGPEGSEELGKIGGTGWVESCSELLKTTLGMPKS